MSRKSRLFTSRFLAIALGTSAMAGQPDRGAESSINPQPLPPRVLQYEAAIGGVGPGSRVMINPQLLSPKQQYGGHGIR